MAGYVTVAAFECIAKELTASGVRFLVVGGLAMQAHGFDRVTYDVDLVIQLQAENIHKAFAALERASYRPAVPVGVEQFADAERREQLMRDKGMVVLNFWSDVHRETRLDVFVAEPFDFNAEYGAALVDDSFAGLSLHFPRAETLLAMKRLANRAKDQNDILFLESIIDR